MATLSGGKIFEARLQEISKSVTKAATLSVGFFAKDTYDDGTSVPLVAVVQEFGAPSRNIPPRPFFRNMIAEKSETWPDAVASLLEKNDYDATQTLTQTGESIVGQLQQSIFDLTDPPLKDTTIKKKGFSKPLIDTGTMWRSAGFKVE